MEAPIKYESTNIEIDIRAVECIWESDFSNAGDWDIEHDPADCALETGKLDKIWNALVLIQ